MAAAAGVPRNVSMGAGGAIESVDLNWYGTAYLNENPEDWAAVALGYTLYDVFGVDMTPEQFRIGMDVYMDQLQRPDPRVLLPADAGFPQNNQYASGEFDYEP